MLWRQSVSNSKLSGLSPGSPMLRRRTSRLVILAASVVASGVVMASAQQRTEPLTMGPARERGASVTPAFEG